MPINSFQKKQAQYADTFVQEIKYLDLDNESIAETIELQEITKHIINPKTKKVLDLGCGTGRIGLKIAPLVKEVIGLDISRNSITIANRTAKKYQIKNFKGIVGDVTTTKYKKYFDYIVMVSFLHHVNDADILMQNLKKILKPNGVCIIFELNPLNVLFIPFLISIKATKSHFNIGYLRSFIYSLENLFTKNGYKIISINKHGFLPTMLYNKSLLFKSLNQTLNKITIIKAFSAFHIICTAPRKKR